MSPYGALHSQVASVMEVLANAAVAEICKLVDEGYALLRLEVSRRQKENRVLRRRIRLMEMKMARGWPCSVTGKDPFADDNDAEGSRDAAQRPKDRSKECAGVVEEGPEPPFIKQENCGDDSIHSCPQEELEVTKERTVELAADAGAEQTSVTNGAEEADDESRSRCAVWEVSASEAVLKAEPEKEGVNRRSPHVAYEHRADRAHSLDSEHVLYEGASQTFFSQRATAIDMDNPWLYGTDPDSESLLVPPDVRPAPAGEDGTGVGAFSAVSPEWKPDAVDSFDSVPIKTEVQVHFWDKESIVGAVAKQHKLYIDGRERVAMQLENATDLGRLNVKKCVGPNLNRCMSATFTPSKSNETQGRASAKEKRFLCAFCGKGFSCPKKVEIHQRVHTGEKPFSCTQCRMRFAQSGNLKRHQRVHTGEKPFSCAQCDKRFSHLHQLKMHQRVHSGERPFSCTVCGKRFGEKSYLRIHQQKSHFAALGAK